MSDVEIEIEDYNEDDAGLTATPTLKLKERQQLSADIAEYLKSGGKITRIETGECKDTMHTPWAKTETAYKARQERAK